MQRPEESFLVSPRKIANSVANAHKESIAEMQTSEIAGIGERDQRSVRRKSDLVAEISAEEMMRIALDSPFENCE